MFYFVLFILTLVIFIFTNLSLKKLHSKLHTIKSAKQNTMASNSLPINSIAPSFSLETLTGNIVTLEELRDKPVILLIAADTCDACSLDIIEFREEARKYGDNYNFVLIVATSDPTMLNNMDFVEETKLQVLLATMNFMKDYKISMIPTFLFLDERGTVLGSPYIVNQFDRYYKLLGNSTITA
ncbi:TlpA disulfide reductase family protein [Bacillus mycoides]|uniref:Alkyl hydroperoxide reductase n=2 Tax=Bacillus cereus group TaxID=86661 RepID=A0A243AJH2_BACTU|nr:MULTISPECIES: TlpA disulfide reductase family protein [Bacillus cereus group]MED1270908.1 TlpA disulfide reductase family protein [Bacillus mycoides]OOR03480.1 alkyl hydroperoxide reductase [Bacillus mycoides]OTY21459.1 alkyl hydroperoxide reductase [Bacillus thuringiensis serovar navarrensis]WJE67175.1 TlpA disulfide reductase family protein [Bacillus mycoides]